MDDGAIAAGMEVEPAEAAEAAEAARAKAAAKEAAKAAAKEAKEAKAKARYEAKLDRIDAAVARHRLPDDEGVEWCGGTDQPPAV